MPNYTRNELIVYGLSNELKYFYERNRVSEEDTKYISDVEVCELSFEKCVSRSITKVINHYMKKKYYIKSESGDDWDLMCAIWGTKWDACESTVDLDQMNDKSEPHIKYLFNTAWNYPYNWLITISQIFPKLKFRIKHSNEGDGYDFTYIDEFKDGIETKIEKYSAINRCIENNGVENIVNIIIEYCNKENIMIKDYSNKPIVEVKWDIYCKNYLEKYKNDDTDEDREAILLDTVIEYIYDYLDDNNIHSRISVNKELCNFFIEKVKKI